MEKNTAPDTKVIYPKYYKHRLYSGLHTHIIVNALAYFDLKKYSLNPKFVSFLVRTLYQCTMYIYPNFEFVLLMKTYKNDPQM